MNKQAKAPKPITFHVLPPMAGDLLLPMLKGLGEGRTVTRFELANGDVHAEPIHFEIVVTKIGPTRMPRWLAPHNLEATND